MDVAVVDDKAAAMEDFGKVCVLFCLDGEFSVFLMDLDQARLDYGVDAEKSFEIKPTFTIKFQYEAIPQLSHVLRDNLYVFTHPRSDEPVLNLQVYTINLSEKINNTTLELTTCQKCPPCFGPKSRPRAVGYDGNLLPFSSQIPFSFQDWISEGIDNALNDSRVDFEIYDPKGCNSRKLPQLHVCRPKSYNDYYDGDSLRLKLYDSAKSQYREELFRDDKWGGIDFSTCFSIVSYCVDEKRQKKMDHGGGDVRRVDFPSLIERGRRLATSAVSLLKDNPRTPCVV